MSEIQFTPEYIARQHKLLDRYLHDPRIAKFLAALDEIERLRILLPAPNETFTVLIPMDRSDQAHRNWVEQLIDKAVENTGICKLQQSHRIDAGYLAIGYKQVAKKPLSDGAK